jgi:hypothetical protein
MLEKYILVMYGWRMASAPYLSISKNFHAPTPGKKRSAEEVDPLSFSSQK